MLTISLFISLALIGMAGIAVVNALVFPRLGMPSALATFISRGSFASPAATEGRIEETFVSLLIPARNEAEIIEQTVRHLLAQTYTHFELIVLDDNSTDNTYTILETIQTKAPRLCVIQGQPLPDGWLGKMWGCHQLAQAAQGEWLIFTDADVRWQPEALAALVTEMSYTQADLLTIWPTQQTESWAERLVVPLMALVVIGYLSLPFVHHTPWSIFAAANGQCLAFRRRAYEKIGGHYSVRNEVLEDVVLARRVKAHGLRLRMADGAGLISCRMYRDWPTVRDGYAKNILAGYGDKIIFLGLATLFHWLIFLWPWLWLILGIFGLASLGWPTWPLILIVLGVNFRALTAAVTRQRLGDALLMPLSVLLMTAIAGQAVWWQWRYGGPRWKGRTIKRRVGRLEGGKTNFVKSSKTPAISEIIEKYDP